MSEPRAKSTSPAATAEAEPDEEPPGILSGQAGLRGVPYCPELLSVSVCRCCRCSRLCATTHVAVLAIQAKSQLVHVRDASHAGACIEARLHCRCSSLGRLVLRSPGWVAVPCDAALDLHMRLSSQLKQRSTAELGSGVSPHRRGL